jgi:hypothetical protein
VIFKHFLNKRKLLTARRKKTIHKISIIWEGEISEKIEEKLTCPCKYLYFLEMIGADHIVIEKDGKVLHDWPMNMCDPEEEEEEPNNIRSFPKIGLS